MFQQQIGCVSALGNFLQYVIGDLARGREQIPW
jgi:hypothetical protein